MKITADDKFNAGIIMYRFMLPKTDEDIFYELLFTICSPQTTFRNNSKVNDWLRTIDYYNKGLPIKNLRDVLKPVRFYNNKAKWVAEAKQKFPEILNSVKYWSKDAHLRKMLVKDVKGLGMKTASHFLRNLGAEDLAIIDTHILKYLGITSGEVAYKKYEELEETFRQIAKKKKLTVAELDCIVWKHYSKTEWKDFVH